MGSRRDRIIRRDEENDELILFLLPAYIFWVLVMGERKNQGTYLATPGSNLCKKFLMDMRRIVM
jgi:hypothetical protein